MVLTRELCNARGGGGEVHPARMVFLDSREKKGMRMSKEVKGKHRQRKEPGGLEIL